MLFDFSVLATFVSGVRSLESCICATFLQHECIDFIEKSLFSKTLILERLPVDDISIFLFYFFNHLGAPCGNILPPL